MRDWFKIVAAAPVALAPQAGHAAQYASLDAARAAAFPGATAFVEHPLAIAPAAEQAIASRAGASGLSAGTRFWEARGAGGRLGWAVLDRVIGKHELITYLVALDPHGVVSRVEILDYRENYGGEVRNRRWLAQFAGKRPGATLRLNRDIQNISGATLSSGHLTAGITRILGLYAAAIGNG